ncbi:protein-disulfide reductase DsbD domain-containing protein [Chitinophaga eiseniae]|uniref:Thiol:disulfide interchange protein DsbD N-terminal domain-containing protein n=1 Tax=Chitinophaga eiseniae TaxID=634771 RepID=A0A847SN18_9BACT|nr:protein-disulfide reductase DsbD domain-containing protein [Chitinophaga eiseniae]NLR77352.1 hypothetical protein [Chitinophaga eiseniae]
MKKLLTALLLFGLPVLVSAQILNPAKWNFAAKKINSSTYELHMTATIDAGWHVYAQDTGEGPTPTSFTLAKNPLVVQVGKVMETGKLKKSFDQNFNSEMRYYENQVDFVQKVTVKGKAATRVNGTVKFMACDDHQCLPAKHVPFSFNIAGK